MCAKQTFNKKLPLAFFCLATAIVFGLRPIREHDIWWNLASGQWILGHGIIPHTDPFSYTALGQSWYHLEWGAGVVLWWIYQALGVHGLVATQVFVFAICLYLVGRALQILTQDKIPSWLTQLAILLTAFLSLHRMMIRPDLFSHLFIAVEFFVLYEYAYLKNLLFILPPLFLIWANIHGSAVMGFGLACLFGLGMGFKDKRLIAVLVASALCLLINPYTADIFLFPLKHLTLTTILQQTDEWQSPFHPAWFVLLHIKTYLVVLALTLIACFIPWKQKKWEIILPGIALAYLSLKSGRFTSYFSFWAVPGLFSQIHLLHPAPFAINRLIKLLPILLLIVFAIYGVPITASFGRDKMGYGLSPHIYPTQALQFLKDKKINGRIFNELQFGGHMMLEGFPTFIDARTPIFDESLIKDYLAAQIDSKVFEKLQNQWGFRIAFLSTQFDRELQKLHAYLRNNPGWKLIYSDDVAYVYFFSVAN